MGSPSPWGYSTPGSSSTTSSTTPPRTRLLSEAASRGARVLGGLEMLVWQGVKALELWTGRAFPPDVVPEAIARLGEVLSHG